MSPPNMPKWKTNLDELMIQKSERPFPRGKIIFIIYYENQLFGVKCVSFVLFTFTSIDIWVCDP